MKQELHIKQSVPRQAALIALCLCLSALGVYALLRGAVALGVIVLVFFGICTVLFVWQMFLPAPLTLGPNGFTDRSTSAGGGFLAWKDVKRVFVHKAAGQAFVSVEPLDVEAFLASLPEAKRQAVHTNIAMGFAPVSISLQATGKKPDRVCALMQEYLKDWRAAAGIDNPPQNG